MTFRRQVWRAAVWAIRCAAAGALLVWVAIFLELEGLVTGQSIAGGLGMAMIGTGAGLAGLGVVLRPAHRCAVQKGWLRGGTGRFAQFWLWQDAAGRDRDR